MSFETRISKLELAVDMLINQLRPMEAGHRDQQPICDVESPAASTMPSASEALAPVYSPEEHRQNAEAFLKLLSDLSDGISALNARPILSEASFELLNKLSDGVSALEARPIVSEASVARFERKLDDCIGNVNSMTDKVDELIRGGDKVKLAAVQEIHSTKDHCKKELNSFLDTLRRKSDEAITPIIKRAKENHPIIIFNRVMTAAVSGCVGFAIALVFAYLNK
jgi:hypothetical protein